MTNKILTKYKVRLNYADRSHIDAFGVHSKLGEKENSHEN